MSFRAGAGGTVWPITPATPLRSKPVREPSLFRSGGQASSTGLSGQASNASVPMMTSAASFQPSLSLSVQLGVTVGVSVTVDVDVGDSVAVGVGISVGVAVAVGVDISVGVAVGAGKAVGVGVAVTVGVVVSVGGDVADAVGVDPLAEIKFTTST